MVTEIIKQAEVHQSYMKPKYWIRAGITDAAMLVYFKKWTAANDRNHTYIWSIRNYSHYTKIEHIYPITKW